MSRTSFPIRIPITIIAEGQTERAYFEWLNQTKAFPKLVFSTYLTSGRDKDIEMYLRLNSAPYVIILLDIDNSASTDPRKFQSKMAILKKYSNSKKTKAFFCNYSFETFLLCHKASHFSAIQRPEDYLPLMKTYFDLPDYHKEQRQLDHLFRELTTEALTKARENLKRINKDPKMTPSSSFDELFAFLDSLSNK